MTVSKDLFEQSPCDSLRICYDLYTPDSFNGTIIQIAHGMIEHKGRYQAVCERLAQEGYGVIINDHRGHGKSIDANHPLGEMNGTNEHKAEGFIKAVIDLNTLTQVAKTHFNSQRVVLMGHSMGSLISREYFKRYGQQLTGLILLGSPAYDPLSSFGMGLVKLLRILGAESIGKRLTHQLMLGKFDRAFTSPNDKGHSSGILAWLNRDPQEIERYKQDELCRFVFSLQSCEGLIKGLMSVQECGENTKELLHVPLCILSGQDDPCGHFGKGVEKIAHLYQSHGFGVHLKLYPHARHEILLELNKEEVIQDILDWLKTLP